ncbi:MAG: hypothetical protein RL328_592 [Acidobacteriota bacterium]|jgi:hypothetical protein
MNRQVRQILNSDAALRSSLRNLPRPSAPAGMTTALRVIASRERAKVVRRQSLRDRLRCWREELLFRFENVMRPLAVPAAGGLFSAVALFSTWVVPAYPVFAQSSFDVPTQLSTEARVKGYSTIGHASGDVLVEVTVDHKGQMVDYQIVNAGNQPDMTERRHLENLLVFTTFVPATSFGQPVSSKLRLWFSSSYIDVKG